jgi:hypothetical protein
VKLLLYLWLKSTLTLTLQAFSGGTKPAEDNAFFYGEKIFSNQQLGISIYMKLTMVMGLE